MPESLRKRVRIESCRLHFESQKEECSEWFEMRRKADSKEQYCTQLTSLESVLDRAHDKIQSELPTPSTSLSVGDVYSRCRAFERRQLMLRKIWIYFRDKFNQRDDPDCGPVLAAADEIVWSCYGTVFEEARELDDSIQRPTAPLPYIEPSYSPMATQRADPPPGLQSSIFKEQVQELPIPVVSLPPSCVDNPWWLILLGHEVGHHVQYDLVPNRGLIRRFRDLLSAAIRAEPAPGGVEEAVERWDGRNLEVFADTFAVLSTGAWSAWALGEIVLDDRMLTPFSRYPAGAVRLALLAELCRGLGMGHVDTLQGFDPAALASAGADGVDDDPKKRAVRDDLALVPRIAKGLLNEPLAGLDTLKELCSFSSSAFEKDGEVDSWAKGFCGVEHLAPEQNLRSARLAISGAVCAWATIAAEDDADKRESKREKLAGQIREIIPQCAIQGTRSATETAAADLDLAGDALAAKLLKLDDEALLDD